MKDLSILVALHYSAVIHGGDGFLIWVAGFKEVALPISAMRADRG